MASAVEPLLSLRNLTKTYGVGRSAVCALDGVDFDASPGEFVAIMGGSGSGKSTMMNVLGCLEPPSSGDYRIEGIAVQDLSSDVLALLRNARFGFVFQSFNLLSRTSAIDNVALPLVYANVGRAEREARAAKALAAVGLAGRELARPNQLSGGEQQRVAIARAIVNNPEVLLADEPTGNLDSRRGAEVMEIIRNLNQEQAITVLMVTHDAKWAAYASRQVLFRDGRIVDDRTEARA